MKAPSFACYSMQAVAFTPDGGPTTARLAAELLPTWMTKFNGPPVILPGADMLPPEFPRIQMASADGAWRFLATPQHLTLIQTGIGGAPIPDGCTAFFNEAADRLADCGKRFETRIGRVAAIVTRAVEQDEPGIALARHFCADRWQQAPLNRPEGFELHAHKRYTPSGLPELNSWVRVKTGNLQRAGEPRRAVVVEQDVNTLPEAAANASFDEAGLKAFYAGVGAELDAILKLYFPEESSV